MRRRIEHRAYMVMIGLLRLVLLLLRFLDSAFEGNTCTRYAFSFCVQTFS